MAICKFDLEQLRREILLGGRGRRACSEQGPPPGITSHLWGQSGRRSPWCRKRTSAPQMGANNGVKTTLVLRSRRSWPVAPHCRR